MGIFSVVLGYDIYLNHQTQILTSRYYRAIIDQQQLVIDQETKDRKFVSENIENSVVKIRRSSSSA
jgi:hypothetical protein